MITINEIGSAIYGAYRLAIRDPVGMAYFDRTREGALKSFVAAGLLLPFHVVIVVTRWSEDAPNMSFEWVFVIECLAYVISWTIFPVLMIGVARWIDRSDRYYDFLVSYNWASLVAITVRFPVFAIRHLEILPEPAAQALVLVLLIFLLSYGWFVLKTSLDITGGLAAGLTVAELLLGVMIVDVIDTIIRADT